MRSAASLLLLAWLAVARLGLADTLSPMHCTSYQVGADMLFEQIPAYLEFFGFGTATPEALRAVAHIKN